MSLTLKQKYNIKYWTLLVATFWAVYGLAMFIPSPWYLLAVLLYVPEVYVSRRLGQNYRKALVEQAVVGSPTQIVAD
jgi:chromate transport protein ChrA